MEVIAQFLPVEFQIEELPQGTRRVRVNVIALAPPIAKPHDRRKAG